MDIRLMDLAVHALENRVAEIELEMEAIRIILNSENGEAEVTTAAEPRSAAKRRKKTAAERKAHSLRMKQIWAQKKAAAL